MITRRYVTKWVYDNMEFQEPMDGPVLYATGVCDAAADAEDILTTKYANVPGAMRVRVTQVTELPVYMSEKGK